MSRIAAANRVLAAPRFPARSNILDGTVWALQAPNNNDTTPAAAITTLTSANVAASLAMPGVAGYSVRIPWYLLWSNGVFNDAAGIMQACYSMLRAGQRIMFRFVAGTNTPGDVIQAVPSHVPVTPCGTGVSGTGATATFDATHLFDSANPFTVTQNGYQVVAANGSYGVCAQTPSSGQLNITGGWVGGTPPNGTAYFTGAAPNPFNVDSSPNTLFEAYYRAFATSFFTAAINIVGRAKLAMIRMPWYGDQFAELNHGTTIRNAAIGYTYAAFKNAHQRLFQIAQLIASLFGLPYEHPLTGCGPIHGGANPLSQDLANFMVQTDAGAGLAWVQGNGASLQAFGSAPNFTDAGQVNNNAFSMAGTTSRTSETAFKAALATPGLQRAAQMINPGNFTNWREVFNGVLNYGSRVFEVYAGTSFTGANAADLQAEIARYALAFKTRPSATRTVFA